MSRRGNRLPPRRRVLELLAAVGGGGLAGCFSPNMGGPVAELSVDNATDRSVPVSLDVTRVSDGRPVLDEEFTLPPESSQTYPDPFEESGRKRLEVVAGNGRRASREWDGSADPDSAGLDVTIYEDEVDVDQVVA